MTPMLTNPQWDLLSHLSAHVVRVEGWTRDLARLFGLKLIDVTERAGKRVFYVTAAGRAALARSTKEPA